MDTGYTILLFYKYVTIEDPEAFKEALRVRAQELGLKGRILVAEEGINGTVEGTPEHAEAFAAYLLQDSRLSDMRIKRSEGTGDAFPKLVVKVRKEIVGTQFPSHIDPRKQTATHIEPETLKEWFKEGKDVAIVDMRNDYEYQSGRFKGSINPGLENSRDLPKAMEKLEHLKDKTVLTVCTGGVRCEKMSAYLLAHGFTDVYQLEDGMHGYMQKFPGEDFEGALYTFDKRKTMHFGGEREIVGVCYLCGAKTEDYVNCRNDFCHHHFLACSLCTANGTPACSEACQTATAVSAP